MDFPSLTALSQVSLPPTRMLLALNIAGICAPGVMTENLLLVVCTTNFANINSGGTSVCFAVNDVMSRCARCISG